MDCISDHIHVTGDIPITLTESVENENNKNQTRQFWFCGKNFILTASSIFQFLKAEFHWSWTDSHSCGMRVRCWNEVFDFVVFLFIFLNTSPWHHWYLQKQYHILSSYILVLYIDLKYWGFPRCYRYLGDHHRNSCVVQNKSYSSINRMALFFITIKFTHIQRIDSAGELSEFKNKLIKPPLFAMHFFFNSKLQLINGILYPIVWME